MREVDPFDYWDSHSSAIEGLGGADRSPDPRYCFHTRYHEVRPGRANFILRMNGVRASFGELSMRVHAWRPGSDTNISLVSGARLLLHAAEEETLTLPVHFASQKGVLYALYGYLSEDSDVSASDLRVAIDELEESDEARPDPPRSILAMDREIEGAPPPGALLHHGRLAVDRPVSQSCTHDQIAALRLSAGDDAGGGDHEIVQWSERLCLNALDAYGITYPGLEGMIVGPVSPGYVERLTSTALVVREAKNPPPPRSSSDFYDFLLMPAALGGLADAHERWEELQRWFARLKVGGFGIVGLRYQPDSALISSSAALDTQILSRNEIGQWVLRLIGATYSVAPLAFAAPGDLVTDSEGLAGFIMIVRRL